MGIAFEELILTKPGSVRPSMSRRPAPAACCRSQANVSHDPRSHLAMFGQEPNPEPYAIGKAEMLIKGRLRVCRPE
ncbi:hypothetical protein [Methylobacterium sp. ID0610]|uniref:hypothetical protein n=1 Tax=Methylobacterium carpenticola TaxID=3344827 RepID=UPI0036CC52E5